MAYDKLFPYTFNFQKSAIDRFNQLLQTVDLCLECKENSIPIIEYPKKLGKNYSKLINEEIIGNDGMLIDLKEIKRIVPVEIKVRSRKLWVRDGWLRKAQMKQRTYLLDKNKLFLLVNVDADSLNIKSAYIGNFIEGKKDMFSRINFKFSKPKEKVFNIYFKEENKIFEHGRIKLDRDRILKYVKENFE